MDRDVSGIKLSPTQERFSAGPHLLVFCLFWLLRCPALLAFVRLVPWGADLWCSGEVRVALCAHRTSCFASLGWRAVHLQAPQLTALEAALVHDATRPPWVRAIACWFAFWREETGGEGKFRGAVVIFYKLLRNCSSDWANDWSTTVHHITVTTVTPASSEKLGL